MSVEQNVEVVRRFTEECWGRGNLELVDELVAEDAQGGHGVGDRGPDAFKREITAIRGGFSNYESTVEDVFGAGERVCIRWHTTGIHTQPLMGVPASGASVDIMGVDLFELRDGKIVRHWGEDAVPTLLRQIGALQGDAE